MPDLLKSLIIDEDKRLVTIRLMSRDQAERLFEGLNERLLSLEAPWEYDAIYDLRRYHTLVDLSELSGFAKVWAEAINGRDAGRVTLIVTRDPILRARKAVYQEHSPRRTLEMFDTVDEALEWLEVSRRKVA